MRRSSFVFVLTLAFIAAACTARAKDPSTSSQPRKDPTIMDTTDLWRNNFSTVYDAVSRLHGDWLLPRGGPQGVRQPELGVWVEGQLRTRPAEFLKSVRVSDVRQVRRLTPGESLHVYSWPWGGLVLTLR
jgi:hypothetical protein